MMRIARQMPNKVALAPYGIGPSGTEHVRYNGPNRPVKIGLIGVPSNTEGGAQAHPVSFMVASGSWRVREAAPSWTRGKAAFNDTKTQAGAPLVNWHVAFGSEPLPRAAMRGPVTV